MPTAFRTRGLCLALALAFLLAACAKRTPRPAAVLPPAPDSRGSYIDIEPGWRISVITPLLKSGKYVLDTGGRPMQVAGSGNQLSVTLSAGPDFLGYERSYYSVSAARGQGVRLRFAQAETVQDGKTAPRKRPLVELFRLPRHARHVRLIYLVRASQADHNMAVAAASNPADLQSLTSAQGPARATKVARNTYPRPRRGSVVRVFLKSQLQADPANACRSLRGRVCQWIPPGIAVRPERPAAGTDSGWAPAR